MTGTLNILEQFLNLLNLPYLRLDGSTPVERRQLYSAEFNRPDSKYQCMILSSRAGGIGLNLTGASSVIFYDLDWNPQMDRQCMDRAHRIGQVRDVEVYKMVSEKTVEENILRRAEQKSLLDQTVIQEGHFTTEYQQQRHPSQHSDDEDEDDVAAAIERFLGGVGNEKATTHAIESVEDKEDVQAAQQARKEEVHADDADFAADRSSKGLSVPPTPVYTAGDEEDEERKNHVDNYMIKFMERLLKDAPFVPPQVRKSDRHGRDPSHRKRKR
jgi:helicase SWR1